MTDLNLNGFHNGVSTAQIRPFRVKSSSHERHIGVNSCANEWVKFNSAARADEVAIMCGSGCNASNEFTLVIEAFADCFKSSRKARTGCKTLKYFSSISFIQSSSCVFSKFETRPCPALLISMSTLPKLSLTSLANC